MSWVEALSRSSRPPELAEFPRGSTRPASGSHHRGRRAYPVQRSRDILRSQLFSWDASTSLCRPRGLVPPGSTNSCQFRRSTLVLIILPITVGEGCAYSEAWPRT